MTSVKVSLGFIKLLEDSMGPKDFTSELGFVIKILFWIWIVSDCRQISLITVNEFKRIK